MGSSFFNGYGVKRKSHVAMRKGQSFYKPRPMSLLLRPAMKSIAGNCSRSSRELGLDLLHDRAESSAVMDSHVRQDLAVNFDTGFFQAVSELAVSHAK